jgi:hypothetical protein
MEKAITGSVKKSLNELHKRTLEIQERARKDEEERLENGVVYLPTWREDRRGSPNSFLRSALFAAVQSKDRVYLDRSEIFSQQGIKVTYTGKQLNQEDLTVWLALVDLAKQHPLGTECSFTAHGILKHMGVEINGQAYEKLRTSIVRMTACLLTVSNEKITFSDRIIDRFVIDEETKHYKVTIGRHSIKLFSDNDWTGVCSEQRKFLSRKPLALALHGYYSSHEEPLPVSVEFLARITGSTNRQKASFKRQVKTAMNELIKVGLFKSYSIDDDMFQVERTKVCNKKSQ